MVSEGTKKGIITAGVGGAGFAAGMLTGYLVRPAIEGLIAPDWAKNIIEKSGVYMRHSLFTGYLTPRFIGLEKSMRGEEVAVYLYKHPAESPGTHYEVFVNIVKTADGYVVAFYRAGGAEFNIIYNDETVDTLPTVWGIGKFVVVLNITSTFDLR